MKSIYPSKMQEKTNDGFSDISSGSFTKKQGLKTKLSLMQFALTPTYNIFNEEKLKELNMQISPLKSKRMNSMNLNFPHNELIETAGFNFKDEPLGNRNLDGIYYPNEPEIGLNIKSKIKNQSELNVSLKFLREKSFRKSEIKNNLKVSPAKGKAFKSNFSNTTVVSEKTENPFCKFFKKPLTFRVSEFEDKNQIENDEKNKQNKIYAQQRFFGHTMNESNTITTNLAAKSNMIRLNSNNSNTSKNSNLDDIEKVMLVNNEEELVKKYVLPEIKYLSTNERNKLCNYDVNDDTDRFIIKKSNGVFLSDLLKNGLNSSFSSPLKHKRKLNKKESEKTKNDVYETKFGTFPKFLIKTSGFVKFGESASMRKMNIQLENNNSSPKKFQFNQTVVADSNLYNFSINNNKHNINTGVTQTIFNNGKAGNINLNNYNNAYNENDYCYNEEKNIIKNKTSASSFNYKTNDLHITNKPENNSNIIDFNNTTNFENTNNNRILSSFYSKLSNTNNKALNTRYISSNGYEIDRDKYLITNDRKHNRNIILDYPKIKFPIQPYKKTILKKKENPNYLTNGSILKDPETMKNIKLSNEKISQNFRNEKGNLATFQMTQTIDKLSKIEKKIADLIELSRVNMKDKQEFKKFTSNASIVIIK